MFPFGIVVHHSDVTNLDNWAWLLSTAEFTYNNAKHEATGYSPFFLEYCRHPRAGPTLLTKVNNESLDDIMKSQLQAQEHAKASLALAAERMKCVVKLKWTCEGLNQGPPVAS
jgi:hypothetical protein